MGNLTLNAKVYASAGWLGKIFNWQDRSGGVAAGFSTVSVSVDQPANVALKDSVFRVKWKLKRPTVTTADTVQALAGTILRNTILDIVFTGPSTGTTTERQEFLDELDDLVASTEFRDSILGLANPGT